MNPLLMGAGAAAIPLLMSQFMPKPQVPGAPDYSQILAMYNTPQMSGARNQMLNDAFNPNANLYQLSSNQAMASMNRALAQRGLANTGFGVQALADQNTQLANSYQQNQLNRELQAYQAASGALNPIAGLMSNQQNAVNQNAMLAYQQQMQGQQALMGGVNNGLQAGMSAYQYNNLLNRIYPGQSVA